VARKCVFCGGERVTKEHVFPDWLKDVLPPGQKLMWHSRRSRAVGSTPEDPEIWEGPTLETEVKRVCHTCNHEWMSDLEGDAKPILIPMILGKPARLSVPNQEIVAAWGFKTFLMLHLLHKQKIPTTHYKWLHDHNRPPESVRISIGEWAGSIDVARYDLTGSAPTPDPTSDRPNDMTEYRFSFNVGHLVYAGFGEMGLARTGGALVSEARFYVAEIWPTVAAITWPPSRLITDDVWRAIHPTPL
jgi:hypothetical protein